MDFVVEGARSTPEAGQREHGRKVLKGCEKSEDK